VQYLSEYLYGNFMHASHMLIYLIVTCYYMLLNAKKHPHYLPDLVLVLEIEQASAMQLFPDQAPIASGVKR